MSVTKRNLFATQGVVIVVIALGYTVLVFVLVNKWSNLAGEAILGYALFAQSSLREFFTWLHSRPPGNGHAAPANPEPKEGD